MSVIRDEFVFAALNRADALIDYDIQNDIDKRHEFRKQSILADESLTNDERLKAIKLLNKSYDNSKILFNEGVKRICENCYEECLATLYCENCVRNYLKANFSNWTSGNNDVDNLIQECQIKSLAPYMIVEWIPYNNLQNIKYLVKGGHSEIYSADWIGGHYFEWDSKVLKIKRLRTEKVVLKRLENVESANRNWLEEGKSHLTISNKWPQIAKCYGLTKNPSDGDYMLVMKQLDINLRDYLQQNHYQLTWKNRIQIIADISEALLRIHKENAIHRDLHSGNILCSLKSCRWYISDLGFCGPADKPLNSIYGNLSYIAPEVIAEKKTTFASDIYSIGILMWEISSGKPPFAGFEHDYDLAMKIINGMRPKVVSKTPLGYESLMKQCWDADSTKRPDINIFVRKIREINKLNYQNEQINNYVNSLNFDNFDTSPTSNLVRNFSKIHIFENLPEPRNATEEEQKAYHSMPYDFAIPDNLDSFDKSERLSEVFRKLQINEEQDVGKSKRIYSNNSDDEKEDLTAFSKRIQLYNDKEQVRFQKIQRGGTIDDDDDELYNNPNLHSEEQDELEIPEDI